MSFIKGKPLYGCWFDHAVSFKGRDACRQRVLEGIAEAPAALQRVFFTTGGSILFNQEGIISVVGLMRCIDHESDDNSDDAR